MTVLFLILLAAAWVAVFFPAAMRARQDTPLPATERFRRRLNMLAPRHLGAGRYVVMPETGDRIARYSERKAQERRIRIFVVLLISVPLSAIVAVFAGGGFWLVTGALTLSLALYCTLLIEAKRRNVERTQKVRSMATRRRQIAASRQQLRARAAGGRRG